MNELIRAAKICGASFLLGLSSLSLVFVLFKTGSNSTWLSGIAVFPLLFMVSASLLCHAWTGEGLIRYGLHRLKQLFSSKSETPARTENPKTQA